MAETARALSELAAGCKPALGVCGSLRSLHSHKNIRTATVSVSGKVPVQQRDATPGFVTCVSCELRKSSGREALFGLGTPLPTMYHKVLSFCRSKRKRSKHLKS